MAPVPDPGGTVGELVARVSAFGTLHPFLDDPAVEEIWINDPRRVFVARRGHELTNLMLTTAQVNELVERMRKSNGSPVDIRISLLAGEVGCACLEAPTLDVEVLLTTARAGMTAQTWMSPLGRGEVQAGFRDRSFRGSVVVAAGARTDAGACTHSTG